jgi:hypothetical protein
MYFFGNDIVAINMSAYAANRNADPMIITESGYH